MQRLFALLICAAMFATHAVAREIVSPDATQMDLIYRFLASDPPDFEQLARQHSEVRQANEFERANVLQRVEGNLRRDFELMKEVDAVRIRTGSRFSEYDADQGAFLLSSISPESYFQFGPIQLFFENAEQFQAWKVPVAEARDIVNANPFRDVVLDIAFRPFAIDASRGKRLRAQIIGLDIVSKKSGNVIASFTVPESEHREQIIAGLPTSSGLESEKVEVLGLNIGMNAGQAADWAAEAGYSMYVLTRPAQEPFKGADGAATLKELLSQELEVPPLFFASDSRAFTPGEKTQMSPSGMSRFVVGGDMHTIFGPELDCGARDNLGVKCGVAAFETVRDKDLKQEATNFRFGALLQSATGVTREHVIALLSEKYGPPSDNIRTTIFDSYETNLLVWGRSRQNDDSRIIFSPVTRSQNWEVEAYIVEPSGNRVVVITHINNFGPSTQATASGGGEIKF